MYVSARIHLHMNIYVVSDVACCEGVNCCVVW